jgi:hypothetical protein
MAGWNNVQKNYDGQLEGFKRIDAAGQKRAEEAAVLAWLRGQGDKGAAALSAHAQLISLLRTERRPAIATSSLAQFHNTATVGAAAQLYRLRSNARNPTPSASPATRSATCLPSRAA